MKIWISGLISLSLAALRPYTRRYREGTSLIATADLSTGKLTYTEPAPYQSITARLRWTNLFARRHADGVRHG